METTVENIIVGVIQNKITPKEITLDKEFDIHMASFGYYEGLKYAKDLGLQFTTSFNDVFKYTHYIVCCGDVMVRVKPNSYPLIERRVI